MAFDDDDAAEQAGELISSRLSSGTDALRSAWLAMMRLCWRAAHMTYRHIGFGRASDTELTSVRSGPPATTPPG